MPNVVSQWKCENGHVLFTTPGTPPHKCCQCKSTNITYLGGRFLLKKEYKAPPDTKGTKPPPTKP